MKKGARIPRFSVPRVFRESLVAFVTIGSDNAPPGKSKTPPRLLQSHSLLSLTVLRLTTRKRFREKRPILSFGSYRILASTAWLGAAAAAADEHNCSFISAGNERARNADAFISRFGADPTNRNMQIQVQHRIYNH